MISEVEQRAKDIAWETVRNELTKILNKNVQDRSTEERRCAKGITLQLVKKLSSDEQGWEHISPDVWVYLDNRIRGIQKWRHLNI